MDHWTTGTGPEDPEPEVSGLRCVRQMVYGTAVRRVRDGAGRAVSRRSACHTIEGRFDELSI